MHPSVENAIEEIDAALFNGDGFNNHDGIKLMKSLLERWGNRVTEIQEMVIELEKERANVCHCGLGIDEHESETHPFTPMG